MHAGKAELECNENQLPCAGFRLVAPNQCRQVAAGARVLDSHPRSYGMGKSKPNLKLLLDTRKWPCSTGTATSVVDKAMQRSDTKDHTSFRDVRGGWWLVGGWVWVGGWMGGRFLGVRTASACSCLDCLLYLGAHLQHEVGRVEGCDPRDFTAKQLEELPAFGCFSSLKSTDAYLHKTLGPSSQGYALWEFKILGVPYWASFQEGDPII